MVKENQGLKCERYGQVKEETLKRDSCEKLWRRMECYSIGRVKNKQRVAVIPYYEGDTSTDTPVGRSFTNLFKVMNEKKCPAITATQMKNIIQQKYPDYEFHAKYGVIHITEPLTTNQLKDFSQDIESMSGNMYKIKKNNKNNNYYIAPTREISNMKD